MSLDGDDTGKHGTPLPPIGVFDDAQLDTPNCPNCLMRMEAEDAANGEPYWTCTECGHVALT